MADRSVKVTLRANVADFNQQVKSASKTLDQLVAAGDKTGKVADTGLGRMAQRGQLMGSQLTTAGTAVTAFGAGLLGVATKAVSTAASFDQSMSNVQAATHETAGNMSLLREAALQAGADTAFSATEAAAGIEELSKAGVSTQDILAGGLTGALDLAAAGGVSVADAAETAASAMTQFNLNGSDTTHVADLLAAAAGKAQGGVHEMSQALQQSGLVASQMGLSIEETTGGLASFASAGLIGSDAGTSFKTMLQRLANPSKEAAGTMKELGINAYDSQGNFVGLANFAGQLSDKMGTLTVEQRNAAMSTIFGSDAVRAASVLYSQGQSGIQGWIDKVNDSGYAAETAAARQDNLRGDLEKLGGSFETLWIRMGSSAQGPLRSLTQAATSAVDAFGNLPPSAQAVNLAIAGLGGAALTGAGGMMILLPRIVETRQAMQELGILPSQLRARFQELGGASGVFDKIKTSVSGMSTSLKAANVAAAAAGVAFGVMASKAQSDFESTATSADTIKAAMESGADSARVLSTAFKGVDIAGDFFGATSAAEDFGKTLRYAADPGLMNEFGQSIAGAFGKSNSTDLGQIRTQFQGIGEALAGMDTADAAEQFNQLWDAAGGGAETGQQLLSVMPAFRSHLEELASAAGLTADNATLLKIATGEIDVAALGAGQAAGEAAGGIGDMGDAAGDASQSIADVTKSLKEMYGVVLSERDAQRGFEEALDAVTESIAQNGTTMDITTEKGRANQAALDGIASSALDVADSMAQAGASQGDIQAKMTDMRAAFIDAAGQFGITGQAAQDLADQLGLIPEDIAVTATADTSQAQTAVDDFVLSVDGLTGTLDINGQTFPAEQSLSSLLSTIDASQGTTTINGQSMPASQALMAYLGIVNNSDGTVSINGDPTNGRYKLNDLVVQVDKSTGTVSIGAKDNATGTVRSIVAGFPSSHTITVTTNFVENHMINSTFRKQAPVQRLINGHATGGAIYGPGTGTSDSILARLSNGEHVWTASEVAAIGGQARMYQLRAMARAGMLSKGAMGFAQGGSPAVHATVPAVYVNPGRSAAPTSNVTVMVENPLTGEQIRRAAREVADGQIVRFSKMGG